MHTVSTLLLLVVAIGVVVATCSTCSTQLKSRPALAALSFDAVLFSDASWELRFGTTLR